MRITKTQVYDVYETLIQYIFDIDEEANVSVTVDFCNSYIDYDGEKQHEWDFRRGMTRSSLQRILKLISDNEPEFALYEDIDGGMMVSATIKRGINNE